MTPAVRLRREDVVLVGAGGLWLSLPGTQRQPSAALTAQPSSAAGSAASSGLAGCGSCRVSAARRRQDAEAQELCPAGVERVNAQTISVGEGRYQVRDLASTWDRTVTILRLAGARSGGRWIASADWDRHQRITGLATPADAKTAAVELLARPRGRIERSDLLRRFVDRLRRRLTAIGLGHDLEVIAAAVAYFAGDDVAGEDLMDVVETHRDLADAVQALACLTAATAALRSQRQRRAPGVTGAAEDRR